MPVVCNEHTTNVVVIKKKKKIKGYMPKVMKIMPGEYAVNYYINEIKLICKVMIQVIVSKRLKICPTRELNPDPWLIGRMLYLFKLNGLTIGEHISLR